MKEILELLLKYKDDKNAEFQFKLTPTKNRESFLGVRMPDCRIIAKEIKGTKLEQDFLNELPHTYYDEDMLHSVILSQMKDYDRAILMTENFLPFVDNWATCDTMHSKCLGKNKKDLLSRINVWIKSNHTYTVRFGVDCLMNYFLDEDFDESFLELVGSIRSEEYYINMMIAWYYATALVKKYDSTIKYLELKKLPKWIQNKSIQKAKESYRISNEVKEYLNTLKIN